MKVMILHPQMALYGGAEVVVVRLAKYLMSRGHYTAIATLSTAEHPDYKGLYFLLPPPTMQIEYKLRGSLAALWDVNHIARGLNWLCKTYSSAFDIINAHNFPSMWAIPPTNNIVWMCNEVPDLWHGSNGRFMSKMFEVGREFDSLLVNRKNYRAIVADDKVATIFRNRYHQEPEVVPYGIDSFEYPAHRKHVISKYHLNMQYFKILCPSMVSPSKNQLATLQAAVQLREHNVPVQVILSGYCESTHPYTKLLHQYIRDQHLNVVFVPPTSREELQALYQTVEVAVFMGKGQGSWLGPFEQLSAGTPVIVSPNLTCSSLIDREALGIVSDDLVGMLEEVQKNYSLYHKQAQVGQKYVLTNLTWDKFCAKLTNLMCMECGEPYER